MRQRTFWKESNLFIIFPYRLQISDGAIHWPGHNAFSSSSPSYTLLNPNTFFVFFFFFSFLSSFSSSSLSSENISTISFFLLNSSPSSSSSLTSSSLLLKLLRLNLRARALLINASPNSICALLSVHPHPQSVVYPPTWFATKSMDFIFIVVVSFVFVVVFVLFVKRNIFLLSMGGNSET